ncbi:hypothetical protein F4556_000080 [Kitasatospora gansuensis]|uniref:Uncharacterized protein n=1 Tax=Kitasatospora gansuensis TaxID=258050 RepID=A0A7W7S613_9ACTN|nr:hypothetical protein [Kitasatospora gansuensis]
MIRRSETIICRAAVPTTTSPTSQPPTSHR